MDSKNIKNIISEIKSLDELEAFKSEVNNIMNERHDFIALNEKADKFASKNYITLKEAFEKMSPSLFKSEKGRMLIGRYINECTKNATLRSLHMFVESYNKAKAIKGVNMTNYINESISALGTLNENDLKKGRDAVAKIIKEAYVLLGEAAEEVLNTVNEPVNNALDYVADTKKSLKNLPDYTANVMILQKDADDYQPDEEDLQDFSKFNNAPLSDAELEDWFQAFNDKYGHELSDAEKDVVRRVCEIKDRKAAYNTFKNECIETLSAAIKNYPANNTTHIRLNEMREKINGMSYNSKSFGEDIMNFQEIKSMFSE